MLTVREMKEDDISRIADYWLLSEPSHLIGMGVDLEKIPSREGFEEVLKNQLALPIEQKRSFAVIWLQQGEPVGHCNTNPTVYGEEAFLHLHLWKNNSRHKGLGEIFLKMTVPVFFERLKLKKIISEPYALNIAPNRTLPKAGFTLVKEYITTPGSLNFEQMVKRWELTKEKFEGSGMQAIQP